MCLHLLQPFKNRKRTDSKGKESKLYRDTQKIRQECSRWQMTPPSSGGSNRRDALQLGPVSGSPAGPLPGFPPAPAVPTPCWGRVPQFPRFTGNHFFISPQPRRYWTPTCYKNTYIHIYPCFIWKPPCTPPRSEGKPGVP